MQTKIFYTYILANDLNGTIYIGVTSDLEKRIKQHKTKTHEHSFTSKYGINKLVYYESTENAESAITREKQLKNWKRDWKISLIEKENPQWKDLSENW
jgi:putative endonuclease